MIRQTQKPIHTLDQEFADKIAALWNHHDVETAHMTADALLLELLEKIGFGATAEAFCKLEKWYS
jgi:hypothetical protein